MRYSIIIPTYNKFKETLSKCLLSIIRYTYFTDVEIIVVANGCTDETHWFVETLKEFYPIKLLWFYEAIGYTKATNEGIKAAQGEYLILLNNDVQLLPQEKNDWINILNKPFTKDEQVGITGIMKEHCPYANREFLLFFCVMIKKSVFDIIGLPDEIFSPGYGEDTDWCCRCEDAGFKIVQVPDDSREYYDMNKRTGTYPLYHAGNVTFKNWEGGEELLRKNREILRQRYNKKSMVNIEKALQCDGFMSENELIFLANLAKENKVIAELGSWHGRSTRALGDNTSGVVYAIDTWNGSASEQHSNHASAKQMEGDHAFYEFMQNNFDLVQQGKVIPIRMSSKNAAQFFKEKGILFDAVFIDAGHLYDEVKEDINFWAQLLKGGGTLCGHDYTHVDIWGGVKKAVDELIPKVDNPQDTSIWACKTYNGYGSYGDCLPTYKGYKPKPNIYDCFMLNNETEILDIRFAELYPVIDRFIIVEAMMTHGGKPKDLVFQNNLQRYEKYLNKVTYLVIEKFPEFEGSVTDKSWARERYQRDYIMNGLKDCKENDIIIISDCDEIPNKEVIGAAEPFLRHSESITSLEMDLYYYNEHTKAKEKWNEAKIVKYWRLNELSPCGVRYYKCALKIADAGKHLSYFGGVDKIRQKIEDTAHQEYNSDFYKDPNRIKNAIENGTDLFNRDYVKFEMVE